MSGSGDTPIGFGGLTAYRTDVEKALAEADRVTAGPRPIRQSTSGTAATTTQIQPVHRDRGAFATGFKKIAGWAIGIAIIVAIKAGIWGGVHAVTSNPTPVPDQSTSSAYSPPVVTPDDTTSAPIPNTNLTDGSADTSATGDSSTTPDSTPAATADPTAGDPTAMTKPSLSDTAVLTMSELRYCLAENIRITAEQSELDGLRSDPDHYNRNVDTVNASITDFQSRCAHRSFQVSDRQIAEPQVETQRSGLEAEGRNRVI